MAARATGAKGSGTAKAAGASKASAAKRGTAAKGSPAAESSLLRPLLEDLQERRERIRLGGGQDKIARQPVASWMGNWNPNIAVDVETRVLFPTRAGGLPVLILYNLPFRDCGLYSAGGAGSSSTLDLPLSL